MQFTINNADDDLDSFLVPLSKNPTSSKINTIQFKEE
jgi:hypothetical protein